MRDFKGLERFIDINYAKRRDHRFHAPGCPPLKEKDEPFDLRGELSERYEYAMQPWSSQADTAWVVCLCRAGIIDGRKTEVLLKALFQTWNEWTPSSAENRIVGLLGGDMDLASTVNYGRTLQEPMFRLKLRDQLNEVIDETLSLLATIHSICLENLDTVMVAHTHMNHAQPMTYAHFMVSAFDGIYRSLKQLELAYSLTNLNSGGCGSTSGTIWSVDRKLMADLLGMDGVLESTYDCEASQDHSLAILFALSNIAIHLTRYSMDHYIWAMDEIDMIRSHPGIAGISSFMPQKCDSGSNFEMVRINAANVLTEASRAMFQLKSEPHGDVLQAMKMPEGAAAGMIEAQMSMRRFNITLKNIFPQKERMLKIAQSGYCCATQVAAYLIKERGYGGRLAHSVTATMVRNAREKGLKSYECTAGMLDEAAAFMGAREPGLSDFQLKKLLDPEEFIKTHNNLGGTAPEENKRLLTERKATMLEAERRHGKRKKIVSDAIKKLERMAESGNAMP